MVSPTYPSHFPVLDYDDQYILREQTLEDTENFFHYYTDPNVGKYILATKPASLQDASREVQYCRNLLYSKQGVYWALARKKDNQMIGAIGLYINNMHRRGEITYDLSRDYWRKGIMKKAMQAVIRYAFDTLQLVRIEAVTRIENKASIALLKSLDFEHEGTLKQYRFYNDKAWDIEMFARTGV
ncbi:MAG: GNAT family N-acetyltransferase [Gammaproteobacteria bacterium RIFCSPLOWO2_02_FULL_42_14]|nr:MAG: GNAT family N-acetyltransferase [Gammaproteobacteria bacterium RIFCSPHIGHO2_02_FULL_42_43]OGT27909.1 MAG: GNAT family N-acetyltransferase [Gammaproteobacteria bacterium RIFCSPHIGHO2_01_FULL_42_8]OGT53654.1 MAG: GNAT family N-acetyltransferase [Gammaproteobacteria bacterium RIFCSPHIGHO2_12_FULL_41_25]OGT62719.1 MAG: GNAT family N-acetyltransferase [Gammaproteobacteria bacterium RIFCSPLOWO2_02_FULL_42_14]OGT85620.1 MAG: GNAT family N-acetyltransferase [Gammaproteobacteria bacterium RIFCSP